MAVAGPKHWFSRAVLACIPKTIAVRISLVWVRRGRAVVHVVGHPIAIMVGVQTFPCRTRRVDALNFARRERAVVDGKFVNQAIKEASKGAWRTALVVGTYDKWIRVCRAENDVIVEGCSSKVPLM